jgi:hypothetical protein
MTESTRYAEPRREDAFESMGRKRLLAYERSHSKINAIGRKEVFSRRVKE